VASLGGHHDRSTDVALRTWTSLVPPILVFTAGIGALSVVVPELRHQATLQRALDDSASEIGALHTLVDVRRSASHLVISRWHEILGRPDELQTRRNQFTESITALSSGATGVADQYPAGLLDPPDLASLPTPKDEMSVVGQFDGLAFEAIGAIAERIDAPNLASDSQFVASVFSLHDLATSVRVVRGVDLPPTDDEAGTYIKGNVARFVPFRVETERVDEFLSGATAPLDEEVDLFATIVNEPAAQLWMDEIRWALAGGVDPGERADVDDFDRAAHTMVDEVHAVVDARIDSEQVNLGRQSRAAAKRSRWLTLGVAGAIACLIVGLASAALQLRKTLRQLQAAAEIDQLTAVANRVGVRARTDPWLVDRRSSVVALSVIDVDHFKTINDTYGHQAGDALLVAIADRLTNNVVPSSTAVGRWGGDEFVVVYRLAHDVVSGADASLGERVDGLASNDIARVASRLVDSMREPIDVGAATVSISTSIGSAVCLCGRCDFDDLFREADRRLYDVKRHGRNDSSLGVCRAAAVTQHDELVESNRHG
jgi:diguanylate cyclase (GGDEF)-like protein